jgi:hypothetical protein
MAEQLRQVGIAAVNTAVVARLKADAYTIAYAAKVFNNVPSGTKMPYLHCTGYMDRPSAMFGSRDFAPEDVSFQVHVWDATLGDTACANIMNLVTKALTGTALSITGYTNLYNASLDFADVLIDTTEPLTPVRHGVCRFLLRVCPT